MDWEDLKGTIGAIAPVVGTALGGPAGLAVGSLISKALGVDNNPDAISNEIKNNPDAILKLKTLENDFESKIFSLENEGRANARIAHSTSVVPSLLLMGLTVMVALLGYALFAVTMVEANRELAYILFGAVLAKWGDTVAYFVGTTRSSAQKTNLMMKD